MAQAISSPQGLLGDSSTVEQRTLTPLILVRIQVPQPTHVPISLDALKIEDRYNGERPTINEGCKFAHAPTRDWVPIPHPRYV